MIVDCHAHVGLAEHLPAAFVEEMSEPFARAAGEEVDPTWAAGIDPDAMMAEYRASGVDKVLIYAMAARNASEFGRQTGKRKIGISHVPNEYVAEVHRRFPDLTVPVMSINPAAPGVSAADQIVYAVEELGAKALKLYPTYHHYRPDDREICWPVYKKCTELGLPVIVHQAWTTIVDTWMEYQRPAQLDPVAREFRDLTLTIAHFGLPWVDEAMCLVAKHANVHTDLTFWAMMETKERILEQLLRCPRWGCGYDRLLWGTDYPLTGPAEGIRLFREELPAVAEKTGMDSLPAGAADLILGGNAARIYGL